MFGVIVAFKNLKFTSNNFIINLLTSEWVGFKNFEFFLKTKDAFTITSHTILYNLVFIVMNLVAAIVAAIGLNELRNRLFSKFYQTVMLLPHFLSWVIGGLLAFAFLSTEHGFINKSILMPLGLDPIGWYSEPRYWPVILPIVNMWKHLGYNTVVYLASITNIDTQLYESAVMDGAGKWKQTWHITIPMLIPMMIILTILQIGRIFNADFGLFFQITRNAGALYETTSVIDTYAYNALQVMGDIGMSSALGLYQAVVGFTLVLLSNLAVRKIERDSALF
jgi:putative aldouronate transport system permease protein